MMAQDKTLRKVDIFISSPSDVAAEREAAVRVIERLNALQDNRSRFHLVPLAYERDAPPVIGVPPQQTIDEFMLEASESDIFVCIMSQRIGMPLLDRRSGNTYRSGTEYEFMSAYRGYHDRGRPYILLYRGVKPIPKEADPEQLQQVETFFQRFGGEGAEFQGIYRKYTSVQDFEAILFQDLDKVLRRLAGSGLVPTEQSPTSSSHFVDWGEAPTGEAFVGHEEELHTLRQWLVDDRCRLVGVLGIGGAGKTAMSVELLKQVEQDFDCVIWRSLRNAPPLRDVLMECVLLLSNQQESDFRQGSDHLTSLFLKYLAHRRCLIVLDNAESILQIGDNVGQCRPDYEDYCRLFSRAGESQHQSCLLLTSREKPRAIASLEGAQRPVRSLQIRGLSRDEGEEILKDRQLRGSLQDWTSLVASYAGNPLALKLVSATIQDLFAGDIDEFLRRGMLVFRDVRDVLDEQFKRLSTLEIDIMLWLAIEREWVSLEALSSNLLQVMHGQELLSAMIALQRRSLIERSDMPAFTLQPVVMEYLTEKLIQTVQTELINGNPITFLSHALLKAQAKDYLRMVQQRLILQPLSDRLVSILGKAETEMRLRNMLPWLRSIPPRVAGYAPGNILNLLASLNSDLTGLDFSGLPIRQAYLRDIHLHRVDFGLTQIEQTAFTETFGSVLAVAYSHDGEFLAGGTTTSEIRVWNAADGKQLLICKGHKDWVRSVDFTADGRLIGSGSEDQTVRIWDAGSGQCIQAFEGHTGRVRSVAFSPDGTVLASGSEDLTVRLWPVAGEARVSDVVDSRTLVGHTGPIRAVTYNASGTLLISSGDDESIRVWDIQTGECMQVLRGHKDQVWSVKCSNKGDLIVSAGEDAIIRVWNARSGALLQQLQGHMGAIRSVSFDASDSLIASASEDETIKIWNLASGECIQTLHGHSNRVRAVAFSSKDRLLASGSEDQTVRIWDADSGRCVQLLKGYTNRVWAVAFNPDDRLLANGSDDASIRLWDPQSGSLVRTLYGHTNQVRAVAFSPDSKILVSASDDRTVRLWNVPTGSIVKTLYGHSNRVSSIAISSDNRILATGSDDQTIRLWSMQSGDSLAVLRGHHGWVWSVAFSPDGSILASGSEDKTTRLWSSGTGELRRVLDTGRVWSLAFSPKGTLFATGCDDRTVRIWDPSTGVCVAVLEGHEGRGIWSVAFSPDGSLLASGGDDQTVRLWDTNSWTLLHTLHRHSLRLRAVTFSHVGALLATAGDDELVNIWEADSGIWLRTLRALRPYEGLNISGAMGLTEAQKATLRELGAIESQGG